MAKNDILLAHRRPATEPLRAHVHDLRNLFMVVASARSLLERPLDEPRKRVVIDGLARVATEGKALVDALLSGELDNRECGCDAAAELLGLAAMVQTLERPGLTIEMSIEPEATWILMPPADLHAIALELLANAVAAGAGDIRMRMGRRGRRLWLTVADDGSGFSPSARTRQRTRPAGLHGTGLRRLDSAVELAHGKVRIRSRIGRGTVVAIALPIIHVLRRAGADRAASAASDVAARRHAHG
jgi:signal transduction histidine kinase